MHMVTTGPYTILDNLIFLILKLLLHYLIFELLGSPLKSNLSDTWILSLLTIYFKTWSTSQTFLNVLDKKLLFFSTMSIRNPVPLQKPTFK